MQSSDGGFAAFDADNDSTWLNQMPLADVEAVTDPSCPDLTGRVLEMMAAVGYRAEHPVAQARDRMAQEKSVAGRRMVGTLGRQLYLRHLLGAGGPARDRRRYQRAMDQARRRMAQVEAESRRRMGREPTVGQGSLVARARHQHRVADGVGADRIARGRSRASATMRCAARSGCSERQNDDGAWDERELTGNGFPNHFYLRYHLYAHYFPLMALGRFRKRLAETARRTERDRDEGDFDSRLDRLGRRHHARRRRPLSAIGFASSRWQRDAISICWPSR